MPFTVRELSKHFPDLPEEFISVLPEACEFCEMPYVMSASLTGLHCSNPRCSSKVAQRIKSITSELNILGFGESTIHEFIDFYGVTNPMDIFDLREGMDVTERAGRAKSDNLIAQVEAVRNGREFLLWEAVKVQHLPGVSTTAQKLLGGYDSIDKFYSDLHDGGIEWVNSKLTDKEEIGIRAVQIYDTFITYEDDVKEGVGYLRIASMAGVEELTVVVSDQAGDGFSSKNDFYETCRERFAGRFHFNFAGSVAKKSTEFLIWAGADGSPARYTSKVRKVENYNDSGAKIPILTGKQFIDFLDSGRGLSEKWDYYTEKNLEFVVEDTSFADAESFGLE